MAETRRSKVSAKTIRNWPYLARRSLRKLWKRRRALFMGIFAFVLLVRCGGGVTSTLYGAENIQIWNILLSISLLLLTANWKPSAPRSSSNDHDDRRYERIVTILGIPAVIVTTVNLALPATPSGTVAQACRNAQISGARFIALSNGRSGTNARSGPGLSFPQVDRFDQGCSIGFDGYCVGEPVNSPTTAEGGLGPSARAVALTAPEAEQAGGWNDTRWLVMPRHRGLPGLLAQWLSGQPAEDRFVTAALVAPQTPWNRLPYLGRACGPGAVPLPEKVALSATFGTTPRNSAFGVPQGGGEIFQSLQLAASSRNSFNIGFGAWIYSPDDPSSGRYINLDGGAADITGTRRHNWTYEKDMPAALLQQKPISVTVMAIPCLAAGAPADLVTATKGAFSTVDGRMLTDSVEQHDATADDARLAETACAS